MESEVSPKTLADYLPALAAEFGPDEVEFLPKAVSGGMALGLPYIDARDVMRRFDSVVGPANWQFDFDVLSPDGKMVRGKLTVLGVTKCDAGEAGGEEEPLKSAVSDALKRCAVHFGVGRYLYYLPRVRAPFDAQKRRFIEPPRLDATAVRRAVALCGGGPGANVTAPAYTPAPLPSREEAQRNQQQTQQQVRQPESQGDRKATQQPGDQPREDNRTDQQRLHGRYLGAFAERFGKVGDDLRHAIEAVLMGRSEPLQTGAKAKWGEKQYTALRERMERNDPADIRRAAEEILARATAEQPASDATSRERSRSTPADQPAPATGRTAFGHL